MDRIKEISNDLFKYPKTIVFEIPDFQFDTRRVYHVDNRRQMGYLKNMFPHYSITIYDHTPEMQETNPNWRHQTARFYASMFPEHLMFREDAPPAVEEINDDY